MARRKRQYLSDDDPDTSSASSAADDADLDKFSDEDPDAAAERARFTNPYGRGRKRRRDGKDKAIYGIFAQDDDDGGGGYDRNRGDPKLRKCVLFGLFWGASAIFPFCPEN
jgi:tuftelin-interacting protein 11